MISPSNLRVIVLFGLAGCVALHARGEDAGKADSKSDGHTLTQIVQAWKSKEARVQSARFEWKETRTDPAIFEYANLVEGLSPEAKRRVAMPPERTYDRALRLSLQGNMVRFETDGPHWSQALKSYSPRTYVAAFDGEIEMCLFGGDRSGQKAFDPHGFVTKRTSHSDSGTLVFRALALSYRPLQPSLGRFDPESHEVRHDEEVDGRRCSLVEQTTSSVGRAGARYWVDPERDWVVVRALSFFNGKPSTQLDIFYTLDKIHGWTPSGWKGSLFSSGKPKTWFTARVTRYEINVPVPRTQLQVQFPVGTWVTDRVQQCDYFVRDGNVRRIITQEERNAFVTHEELSTTESGKGLSAEYTALMGRANLIAKATPEEQRQFVDAIKKRANAKGVSAWPPRRCLRLAQVAAGRLCAAGQTERAVEVCRTLADFLPDGGYELTLTAEQVTAASRRKALKDAIMEISGTTIEGKKFDWSAYRGKVVLIDFWFMGCRPCVAELPILQGLYEGYRGQKLEIIGITVDRNAEELKKFLQERKIPWVHLYQVGEHRQPTVERYGITSFPTYVVVNKEGKVVSLTTEAKELDSVVGQLLRQ